MKSHDAARRDGNVFTRFGIAAGALGLVAQLEIAETGQLDAFTAFKLGADFFVECLHHIFGLPLVQSDFFKQ